MKYQQGYSDNSDRVHSDHDVNEGDKIDNGDGLDDSDDDN